MAASNKVNKKFLIIGGVSGAGCSTALQALEDFHFATISKIPVPLMPEFINLKKSEETDQNIAILPEIKSEKSLQDLLAVIESIGIQNIEIVFLDATNEAIIKRYSETRRPHPDFAAPDDRTLVDAIQRERNYLIRLKEIANLVLDTSSFTVHDLKREIGKYISLHYKSENSIRINFVSFGFKNGIPIDCDLVIDVRFLPNPYFISEFKEETGLNPKVAEWVLDKEETSTFINLYLKLLNFLIPKYADEGKAYLNIGVGCTGGQHRSVAIAEALSSQINLPQYKVTNYHRDIKI